MKKYQNIFLIFLLLTYVSSSPNTIDGCTTNEDCAELNECNLTSMKCVHKRFFPITFTEIIGLICIVFGSALSNAGGIGGGGLLIPILLVLLKFYTHEAIPISKLMIFTGALTSFCLGFRQRHPNRNSITIDYNIPLLLVPLLLLGTMVGVTLNKVCPPILILVSLTLVLIINTVKTLKKGKELYKKENESLRNQVRDVTITNSNEIEKVGELFDRTNDFSTPDKSRKSNSEVSTVYESRNKN